MKKILMLTVAMLLVFGLLTACGGSDSAPEPAPEESAESETPEENVLAQEEETPAAPAVSLVFDPKAYQNTNSDDYFEALVYATNTGDIPACATIRYKGFDKDGNVMEVYDQFYDRYSEELKESIYIPAGVSDFPIGFTLPVGFGYNYKTGETMPEIDHLEFELIETSDETTEDLKEHFMPGEVEVRENHIYCYVQFDQEIAENYVSIFPDYTLLGYANGVLTTVCCRNSYPYSNSFYSVDYAIENTDNAFLIYHYAPRETIDKWELYLGCIGGEKK